MHSMSEERFDEKYCVDDYKSGNFIASVSPGAFWLV